MRKFSTILREVEKFQTQQDPDTGSFYAAQRAIIKPLMDRARRLLSGNGLEIKVKGGLRAASPGSKGNPAEIFGAWFIESHRSGLPRKVVVYFRLREGECEVTVEHELASARDAIVCDPKVDPEGFMLAVANYLVMDLENILLERVPPVPKYNKRIPKSER